MNDDQLLRYSRQILLPQLDIVGQQKLLNSHVLIIGLGGLGSPVSMYLAAAGVGHLSLVDDDQVELSNLQRQIVHGQQDIGRNKVDSAANTLKEINSEITLDVIAERLEGERLEKAVNAADVVVDCSDNFATRFLLNETTQRCKTPLVSGAAIRMEGQVSVFDSRQADSPCYQCLFPEGLDEQLTCTTSGVMAPLVGIIGSMQAMEAIKLLSGLGQSLVGRLQVLDAMNKQWRTLKLKKDVNCLCCDN